ncbi:Transcription factor zinc-finger [Aliiroseovarius halocynthiae]|nr:Transcription factor zinc-finger [Aliiroseovarius halocynthiae]
MKVPCPRCEQDWVRRASVKKTGKLIFVCPECEATWFSEDEIEYATFNYFNLFMERQGIDPDWSELEILGVVTNKSYS